MPIAVTWYETEERVIVYRFVGLWSWEDCFNALAEAALCLDKLEYPIHQIVDLRQTYHAPAVTFESLHHIAKAAAPNHPQAKEVFVIGLKGGILLAFNVFKKIFPQAASRYIVVHDDSELGALLRREGTVG
jgi:hypothetical protein